MSNVRDLVDDPDSESSSLVDTSNMKGCDAESPLIQNGVNATVCLKVFLASLHWQITFTWGNNLSDPLPRSCQPRGWWFKSSLLL